MTKTKLTKAQRAALATIGSIGGNARTKSLTKVQRRESASNAGVKSGEARRAKRDAKKNKLSR